MVGEAMETFLVKKCPPPGPCDRDCVMCHVQFRAISRELWKTEDYHKAVRRTTVRYMR